LGADRLLQNYKFSTIEIDIFQFHNKILYKFGNFKFFGETNYKNLIWGIFWVNHVLQELEFSNKKIAPKNALYNYKI